MISSPRRLGMVLLAALGAWIAAAPLPADPSVLDGAKAIVFYSDGTSVVGRGWDKTDSLARAGTGLMFMHYAVHPSPADGKKYFQPWAAAWVSPAATTIATGRSTASARSS